MKIPKKYQSTWTLPNNAKLAFTVGIPFEAFLNQSQVNLIAKPGVKDAFSLSYGDYGWKVGVWRLMSLLEEFGVTASMSVNGLAAQLHPEIIKVMIEQGHEVLGHGWVNDVYVKDEGPEKESAEIERVTKAIEQACGVRPVGWTSPGSSGSDHTVELLSKHGYTWVGDDASDDIPFVVNTATGPFVILPRTNVSTNDITMWVFPKNPPSAFFESFKDTFDQLYAEGAAGSPKWLDLTLHSHMAGRATLIPTIRKCLEYVKQHDGIFYTRKCDLAAQALADHEDSLKRS
ncbi:MAG: polysaccharide deacetylase family protein [Polaromonas sp.]|uniref:polysaccharide deacetylase family protein n=1 Tax=Polaromonas sp. TaxID=1869339 RepID=UPI0025FD7303|nr:polysaccharide deacetylase family protein [Polaromonas sp.]MBI2726232.1 polysaccharide deacetylase family protein [Polaromonas sp.]